MIREIAATITANVDSKQVTGFMATLDAAKGSLASLGTALAAGAFGAFIKETLDYNDSIDDMAQRTGASHDSIQRLGYMLKLSGANAEDAQKAIFKLNLALGESADGSGKTAQDLKELGISIKGSNGQIKTATEILPEVAEAIASASSEAEQTTLALKFFGKAGLGMLPMLKQGSKGIAAMSKEFDDLGLGISSNVIEESAQVNDQIDRLGFVTKHASVQLVGALVPALLAILAPVIKLAGRLGKLAKETKIVQQAAVVLGLAFASKVLPQVWQGVRAFSALKTQIFGASVPLIAIIAVFAALYLIFDDLYTLMNGGESFIGNLLDKMGEAGTKATLIKTLKDAWEGVKTSLSSVGPILKDLWKSIAEGSKTWVPALAQAFVGVVKGIVAGVTALSALVAIVAKLAAGDTAGAVAAANKSADAIFGKAQSIKEVDANGNAREVKANVGGLYGISQAEYYQKAKESGISDASLKPLADALAAQKLATTVNITVPPGTDPAAVKVTGDNNATALAAVKAGA